MESYTLLDPSEHPKYVDNRPTLLTVPTEGGDIQVKSLGGPGYPDVSIVINGHCVGFVEWNPVSKSFDMHVYGASDDEPIATFNDVTNLT